MPTVSLKNSDGKTITFELDEQTIVYDGLDEKGTQLPHGCLAGSCGACKIEVINGIQNLSPAKTIEQNTIDDIKKNNPEFKDKNLRLSCRAKVLGDIEIKSIS
jgi:ferredoxin